MNEVSKRRTFAIISHPDAGKTTLTEKLLLYGGALNLAGTVTARKKQRATTSDWMELEKKRGISISSTVLQFDYGKYRINLLDTPGHKDFSEDTYRVLTAVDAVIMVIDAAKGIESQTRKLFEVCRQRRAPIFTFINKLDRPGREPLELIDELEKVLHLHTFPMNWPIGTGLDFRGVYDRGSRQAYFYERAPGGAYRAAETVHNFSDPLISEQMEPLAYGRFVEEVTVLNEIGMSFDRSAVLKGEMTPVFFGSALNNFGVQLLLDGFLEHSPPPVPRIAESGPVQTDERNFSGFIFKIQGNMDPRHRDKVAFLRVCAGRFFRDMPVFHSRTGKKIKLANSHKLFGQEREIMNEAYAGDIIGLVGHSDFKIGDTLSEVPGIIYNEIPRFPPECFTYLHNPSPAKYKSFRNGLAQLILEGIVQSFTVKDDACSDPFLAAVGPLQFEVMQYRLESEYGVKTLLKPVPWQLVRWIDPVMKETVPRNTVLPSGIGLGEDSSGQPVLFFTNEWNLRYFSERSPEIKLYELPVADRDLINTGIALANLANVRRD